MRTVWKFPLQITDEQTVEMPLPAKILTVQPQGQDLCLWAEVNPESEKVKVSVLIADTGHQLPQHLAHQELRYINTFQLHGGALVFHAYQIVWSPH